MRSGSAVRLGRLVKERREAGGYTRDALLSVIASRGGAEVSYDFLVKLELQRRHLALGDPRFWLIAGLLGINADDIAGCVLGAIEDTLSTAP